MTRLGQILPKKPTSGFHVILFYPFGGTHCSAMTTSFSIAGIAHPKDLRTSHRVSLQVSPCCFRGPPPPPFVFLQWTDHDRSSKTIRSKVFQWVPCCCCCCCCLMVLGTSDDHGTMGHYRVTVNASMNWLGTVGSGASRQKPPTTSITIYILHITYYKLL